MPMPAHEHATFRRLAEVHLARALADGVEVRGVDTREGRCGGRPCLAGTRIEVLSVWVRFLEGHDIATLRRWWGLTERQVTDGIRAMRVAVRYGKRNRPARDRKAA